MFLLSYRNTSRSLGEREMLWEHEPQASVSTAFQVLPNFHECFLRADSQQGTAELTITRRKREQVV